jgi:hypothetical protein
MGMEAWLTTLGLGALILAGLIVLTKVLPSSYARSGFHLRPGGSAGSEARPRENDDEGRWGR